MAMRAHADVTITYTPNDCEYTAIEVYGLEAPAIDRWDGDPLDRATVEGMIRRSFDVALERFLEAFDGHEWEPFA